MRKALTLAGLLGELSRRGLRLVADGGDLRCRGKLATITPELVTALKRHRRGIVALVAEVEASPPSWCLACAATEGDPADCAGCVDRLRFAVFADELKAEAEASPSPTPVLALASG